MQAFLLGLAMKLGAWGAQGACWGWCITAGWTEVTWVEKALSLGAAYPWLLFWLAERSATLRAVIIIS
jgi:hypothetical protein